jgi:glycosyltransferase involved in cell wall biosynthesis
VSVVIPTYNAAMVVEAAVSSVAAQSLRDLEVILVDDASSDDTLDRARVALERHGLRHLILRQEQNGGPAAARNRGVVAATGEYVAFLDADDEWLPGKLAAQVAILDADPTVTLCGCQAIWVDSKDREVELLFSDLPSRLPDGWKRLLWQCYIATPCAMVRRDDLGTRPFDPRLQVGEDRDLWIKLASNGTVALVQEVMVRIRLSQGSFMSSNSNLVLTCTRPMIERHLRSFARSLSLRQRMLALGSLNSQIGKSLCRHPKSYLAGSRYLIASVLMGYHPFDGIRELCYTAPVLRTVKSFIKQRISAG